MAYDTQPEASHFIDGAYVEDTEGELIEVVYPATGEVIARVHAATPAVIEKAMGVLLVITGILFMTGQMSRIAQWLLEMFPAFATIG